jgi:short-subunit dehydrogenase
MEAGHYQTALITGASSGIGASLARFLADKGITILLTARREERLETLQKEIIESGGKAEIYPADLSIEIERQGLFDRISSKYQVDILINNAGFGWYGFYDQMPWDIARQMVHINIEAVAHMTSLFLPGMEEKHHGYIIQIGSIAGIFPNQGVVLYSSSKSFMNSFATALYRELHGSGVYASVMILGPVETEFFDRARSMEGGGNVPAEKLAIPVTRVNKAVWRLLKHPRRAIYVPGWLVVTNWVELLFGWLIDNLGPLLLKRK